MKLPLAATAKVPVSYHVVTVHNWREKRGLAVSTNRVTRVLFGPRFRATRALALPTCGVKRVSLVPATVLHAYPPTVRNVLS